jgi:hypothetical protein
MEFRTDRPLSSLLSTTRDVLFTPRRFFDGLPPDGPLRAPVLYVVICVTINTTVRWLLNLILFIPPLSYFASADSPEVGPIFIGLLALFAGLLVLLPVFSIGYFFVFALIQHGLLHLLAGNNQRGFSATLRVLGYATGACKAVSWIPLVNLLIGLYFYYLATTGLRRVHETSTIMALAVALVVPAFWLALVVFAVLLVSRLSPQGGA